jgi:hypothetical protein
MPPKPQVPFPEMDAPVISGEESLAGPQTPEVKLPPMILEQAKIALALISIIDNAILLPLSILITGWAGLNIYNSLLLPVVGVKVGVLFFIGLSLMYFAICDSGQKYALMQTIHGKLEKNLVRARIERSAINFAQSIVAPMVAVLIAVILKFIWG